VKTEPLDEIKENAGYFKSKKLQRDLEAKLIDLTQKPSIFAVCRILPT